MFLFHCISRFGYLIPIVVNNEIFEKTVMGTLCMIDRFGGECAPCRVCTQFCLHSAHTKTNRQGGMLNLPQGLIPGTLCGQTFCLPRFFNEKLTKSYKAFCFSTTTIQKGPPWIL